ncbi:hypothetical protein E3N88_34525 [Mikania micrantha]|uniref:Uncharacterized protein n=1 Tax=Mikania micrantha TaxID=192012 RepID=A0A5N6LYD9_9ASTR|nr:hypothetical protein E3N88_34525 [Mikania micrantha]
MWFASGTNNRASSDNNGITSRHTSGSIGFDEHRINMEAYLSAMIEMYVPGFTQDNVDVWEHVQARDSTSRHTSRWVYGIGDSDISFVVTRAPSSSCGVTPSYVEYRQSQEKVEDLESQLQDLGSQLEMERKLRDEPEQRIEQRLLEQNEIAQEKMQKQMQEFISKFIASSNH